MVAIIIPVLGKNEMTLNCVESIEQNVSADYTITIVDNGNTFRKEGINIIKGRKGWGFAHSCNVGAEAAGDNDLLFLNNDTKALTDFVDEMGKVAGGRIGIVGALLTYPNGRIQHCGSRYNHGNPIHPQKNRAINNTPIAQYTHEVEAVTFACAYVTRECWDDLGGLDETAFPFGYEDIDFCLRARQRGWQVYYCAEARLIHYEHQTQKQNLRQVKPKSNKSIMNLRARWGE